MKSNIILSLLTIIVLVSAALTVRAQDSKKDNVKEDTSRLDAFGAQVDKDAAERRKQDGPQAFDAVQHQARRDEADSKFHPSPFLKQFAPNLNPRELSAVVAKVELFEHVSRTAPPETLKAFLETMVQHVKKLVPDAKDKDILKLFTIKSQDLRRLDD